MRFADARILVAALLITGCDAPEMGPFDSPFDPENPENDLPMAPGELAVEVAFDVVTLAWRSDENAAGYVVYRSLQGTTDYTVMVVDDTVHADGPLAPGVAYDYAVCTLDDAGIEGSPALAVGVVPGPYGIMIDDGALVTNATEVDVTPVAPGESNVVAMGIGSDPQAAAVAEPVSIEESATVRLTGEDGPKVVYSVLYTDSGAHTSAVADTIRLDTTVDVTNFWWCVQVDSLDCDATIDSVSAGNRDVVEFTVVTGETELEGDVAIRVGSFTADPVVLRDPDLDGRYWGTLETRFSRIRTVDAPIEVWVTDAAGNGPIKRLSTRTLTVTD